jgi:hypothetical protein
MEPRTEPRFETNSAVVVEVIRDKTYTLPGRITDVSGLGFRLEMAEPLTTGETIRVTVNGYQMFAQVRHCGHSDSGFAIGVERIDAWEGKAADPAAMPASMPGTQPVAGRPVLKNSVGYLRGAALRGLFANPRLRAKRTKHQDALIFAASIALAACAGGSVVWVTVGHRLLGTATSKPRAAQMLPARPTTIASATPLSIDTANVHGTGMSTVSASQLATVADSTAGSAAGPAHNISIKASNISWVSACADGIMVFSKLFNKGDVGEVHFARQATVQSGNAAATELVVGNQPIGPMGAWGEVKTIAATPAGYQYVTGPTPVCKIERTNQSPSAAQLTPLANSTPSSGAGPAHNISIKASNISWISACADGSMVFSKVFNKDDVEEVHFARQATIQSRNAAATELVVDNQRIGPMGAWGEVKTMAATPKGHRFVAGSVPICEIQ